MLIPPPNLRILPLTFPATWERRRHLLPSTVWGGGWFALLFWWKGVHQPIMTGGSTFCGMSYFACFKKPPGTGLWGGGSGSWRQELSSQEQLPRTAGPDNAQPFLAWALLPIGWMNIILPLVPGQG